MTISPAAGPLIVSCELLMHEHNTPPMTAVQMPAMGGYPLARAIARHSGIAIRNTRKPARRSKRTLGRKPGVSGGVGAAAEVGGDSDGSATASPRTGIAVPSRQGACRSRIL